MKVQKYEIARVIDKLKSIVQKNDQFPALGGILVKDGYLIASNSEITMKVKLEASEGSYFIIPMKAFDLIKNLPDGEIDISATDKNVVMIKIGAIKNKYQSYPPEEFNFDITEDPEADGVELNGKKIMEAIGHVIYAAADGGANTQMTGIYFEGTDSGVSLAALDGHVVAVDSVKAEGAKDMKLIVPKATAKKLISMGVIDDVTLTYTKNSAVFKSDEYTIYTRLIEGKYFAYQKMFTEGEINTCASRTALIGAMTRAKMCTEEKQPAVFQIEDDVLNISIRDKLADYQEQVPLQETVCKSIRLGFDSRLVLETLKAFTCDNIALGFTSPRTPMIVEAEDRELLDVAKKYEVLGEKPEELAKALKTLKNAGGTAFNDMIGILDRNMAMIDNSGVFGEIGKSFSGGATTSVKKSAAEGKIDTIAKGLIEKDPSLSYNLALAKAWEAHPELMAEYEDEAGY